MREGREGEIMIVNFIKRNEKIENVLRREIGIGIIEMSIDEKSWRLGVKEMKIERLEKKEERIRSNRVGRIEI